MKDKSIIIIGAGIAGLSTGCYGQMNGYLTQIFEMHDKPGGLCTSWQRQGYTIDGCLHFLVGSRPGSDYYRFWEELGAIQGRSILYHKEFMRFEDTSGRTFIMYADIDRLEQHMKEIAPDDKDIIEDFIKGIRTYSRFNMPADKAPEVYSLLDGFKFLIKLIPFIRFFNKWGSMSFQDFAEKFKNPLVREAFSNIWFSEFSILSIMMTFSWLNEKVAGYPIGGSLEISRAIENRYINLGGRLNYNKRVVKILVENDCAVGVKLDDGSEYRADYIVSAADGYTTIFNMLDGKYINEKIQGCYDNNPIYPPLVNVALGVKRLFKEFPSSASGLSFPLDKAVTLAGKKLDRLEVQIYNFDPTLAPESKTVMRVMFFSDYNYWESLRKNIDRYKAEKEQIARRIIDILDKRFPGLAAQVEMYDVATPVTYKRYTGNWKGAYQGWMVTTKTLNLRISKSLPGLDNFYMAGQWVEPGGGLPPAALSGRNVIQILCRRDRKSFVTSI